MLAQKLIKRLPTYTQLEGREVVINLAESPLKWLACRKDVNGKAYLEEHEIRAGERFRADFTLAGLTPRLGVNWSNPSRGTAPRDNISDAVLGAKQRLNKAYDALGPELSSLMLDFCGFELGLEEIESKRKWPARSAKVMVKLALAQLARHYGYASST